MAHSFSFLPEPFFSLATDLADVWIKGTRTVRRVIELSLALATIAAAVFAYQRGTQIGPVLAIVAAAIAFGALAYQHALKRVASDERIIEAEREVVAHPDKAKPAWGLATVKLEAYVARNLAQVNWIFGLVILVMGLGFAMIGWGIYKSYTEELFKASLVATGSGILVQFIGATFLLIYKSTMEQAKDYVAMLERINAVSMAADLVEEIQDPDPKVKDAVRAKLATTLLTMYQQSPAKTGPTPKSKARKAKPASV